MKGQKFKNLQIFANKKNQTGKGIFITFVTTQFFNLLITY